ncbi:MAG: hypothetical protein LBD72_01345 [Puniceicoccales bacterium]|nr:hypothetical protein [Puniceicoccales bacterium]
MDSRAATGGFAVGLFGVRLTGGADATTVTLQSGKNSVTCVGLSIGRIAYNLGRICRFVITCTGIGYLCLLYFEFSMEQRLGLRPSLLRVLLYISSALRRDEKAMDVTQRNYIVNLACRVGILIVFPESQQRLGSQQQRVRADTPLSEKKEKTSDISQQDRKQGEKFADYFVKTFAPQLDALFKRDMTAPDARTAVLEELEPLMKILCNKLDELPADAAEVAIRQLLEKNDGSAPNDLAAAVLAGLRVKSQLWTVLRKLPLELCGLIVCQVALEVSTDTYVRILERCDDISIATDFIRTGAETLPPVFSAVALDELDPHVKKADIFEKLTPDARKQIEAWCDAEDHPDEIVTNVKKTLDQFWNPSRESAEYSWEAKKWLLIEDAHAEFISTWPTPLSVEVLKVMNNTNWTIVAKLLENIAKKHPAFLDGEFVCLLLDEIYAPKLFSAFLKRLLDNGQEKLARTLYERIVAHSPDKGAEILEELDEPSQKKLVD